MAFSSSHRQTLHFQEPRGQSQESGTERVTLLRRRGEPGPRPLPLVRNSSLIGRKPYPSHRFNFCLLTISIKVVF